MKFGVFVPPFHHPNENPTSALAQDLDLVVRLEQLGFDEVWVGEHHSAGWEIISSPEVFIAAAAERTKTIRLGTGVSSLPYHHPFILAQRMVLLDHLTRGRIMMGVGPGSLPFDAAMMGFDPKQTRPMMEEAFEVIFELLTSEERVSRTTSWFTVNDASLQLRPYSDPCFEIAVAAVGSPAGPRLAGRFGCSLLSIGATQVQGVEGLGSHWQVAEEQAAEFGRVVDRANWRLVGPMHLADSLEQARKDVEYGLTDWVNYFKSVATLPLIPDEAQTAADVVEVLNDTQYAIVGTAEMAIEQIERLEERSGGFGTYLLMANAWADWPATLHSYEIFARDVMPHFQKQVVHRNANLEWAIQNRPHLLAASKAAVQEAIDRHAADHESSGLRAG